MTGYTDDRPLGQRWKLSILSETDPIPEGLRELSRRLDAPLMTDRGEAEQNGLILCADADGLRLEGDGQTMRCSYDRLLPRLRGGNLNRELLVRAARMKHTEGVPLAVDATAGLGEDAVLLAAAGFRVRLFERNPVIAALLRDVLERSRKDEGLADAVSRMEAAEGDSTVELYRLTERPAVIYLDPMFPGKTKNSLAKKKFQLLHRLELPCTEGEELLEAALAARPEKIVIKRPVKGEYLGGRKPDYSLEGKLVRYDCILPK